ncbi:MAG: glycoside hydrolase family 1 protein [Chloroflexi bacterium]|nr:glycoside hydrolase family 1 protein [Chloroflexota bacterium]
MTPLEFPKGFLWGTATAAHQVEGGNDNNDWWDWEQTPGHIKNGDKSTVACDWWNGERYRQDFDLAQSLNTNAHRLSIEWSRVEPREGVWSDAAFSFYRRVLAALRERGITPLVTLHHFTNPRWLAQKGAWEARAVVPLFERYATRVVQELGDLCDFWVTINEPTVYLYAGYVNGSWTPGKKNFSLAMRVGENMLRAHVAAYHAIHRVQPHARVGLANSITPLVPANPRLWLNRTLAAFQHRTYNHLLLLALQDGRLHFPMGNARIPEAMGAQDFIGVNYYFSRRIAIDLAQPAQLFARPLPPRPWGVSYDAELNEWFGKGEINPDAFVETLKWCARFGKPIFVTENGICDRDDDFRPRYLVQHLAAMHRAIGNGAPVRGYFYWSLIDNFEWAEGYALRFGLIRNDFATQTRTPKPSAHLYARIARENALAADVMEQ